MKKRSQQSGANRILPVLIILFLIMALSAAWFGWEWVSRRLPTNEPADLGEIYGRDENQAAIIANHELVESRALWQLGHAYLPYSVITNELNSRFYWDPAEELLLYTLPEETIQADTESAFDGAPVFLQKDGEVYISLSYVENVSNILAEHFENPNRLVLQTIWGTEEIGTLKKDTQVRVLGGIRSKVVTHLNTGDQVVVLYSMENWSYVQTPDGFLGYLPNDSLGERKEVEITGPYQEPEYTRTAMDGSVSMVWHQIFRGSGIEDLEKFLKKNAPVNVISPTWFDAASEDGTLKGTGSPEYVRMAHEAGLQVWPMVGLNIEIDLVSADLLQPTSHRRKLIESLITELEACGADGVDVDFEEISSAAGEGFIQFVRELSVECRKRGLVLCVDNGVPASGVLSRYHVGEQAIVADYVIVMAYDEHISGDMPGSNASLPFVQQAVDGMLLQIPAEKLICALPFYTRLWRITPDGNKAEAMGMETAAAFVTENGMSVSWLGDLCQNYASGTTDDGVQLKLWLEDAESIKAKLSVLEKYGLGGIAYWKLGMQSDRIWDVIRPFTSQ